MLHAHNWSTQTHAVSRVVAADVSGSGELETFAVGIDATQATVEVRGEVDLANAGLLATVLDDQLALGRRFVRLDLSGLRFLDWVGLGVLVRAHHQFLSCHGIVLTAPIRRLVWLLHMAGLDEILFIVESAEQPRRVRHLAVVPLIGRAR